MTERRGGQPRVTREQRDIGIHRAGHGLVLAVLVADEPDHVPGRGNVALGDGGAHPRQHQQRLGVRLAGQPAEGAGIGLVEKQAFEEAAAGRS